jgi:phosphoserine phosphatase
MTYTHKSGNMAIAVDGNEMSITVDNPTRTQVEALVKSLESDGWTVVVRTAGTRSIVNGNR